MEVKEEYHVWAMTIEVVLASVSTADAGDGSTNNTVVAAMRTAAMVLLVVVVVLLLLPWSKNDNLEGTDRCDDNDNNDNDDDGRTFGTIEDS